MKLLLDQNLSPHLVSRLDDLFPGSMHVVSAGLASAEDLELWDFALQSGFAIVTKDADFNELSVLRGCPPKVIWLQLGNCTTSEVEAVLRHQAAVILDFERDELAATLTLTSGQLRAD